MRGRDFLFLLFVFVVGILIFWAGRATGRLDACDVGVRYDTVTVTVVDYFPVPVEIIPGVVPSEPFDTLAFIRAYLDTVTYRVDTLLNEVHVKYDIGLNRNRIFDLSYSLQNMRPTTLVLPRKKNALGIGALAGFNLGGPTIHYRHDQWAVDLGYNLVGAPNAPHWVLGIQYDVFQW